MWAGSVLVFVSCTVEVDPRTDALYEVRARSGRVARGAMEGRLSDERNARFWLKIFASTQLCQDHPEELWTIPTVGSS